MCSRRLGRGSLGSPGSEVTETELLFYLFEFILRILFIFSPVPICFISTTCFYFPLWSRWGEPGCIVLFFLFPYLRLLLGRKRAPCSVALSHERCLAPEDAPRVSHRHRFCCFVCCFVVIPIVFWARAAPTVQVCCSASAPPAASGTVSSELRSAPSGRRWNCDRPRIIPTDARYCWELIYQLCDRKN